jgi:DNA-binding transcriptional LysR family regulator
VHGGADEAGKTRCRETRRAADRAVDDEAGGTPVLGELFSCDSLVALLGLTIAGTGVSYLPVQCFKLLVAERKLRIVRTRPALPRVPYTAMYRNDRPFAFTALVATMAQSVCDFTRPFQG